MVVAVAEDVEEEKAAEEEEQQHPHFIVLSAFSG